MAGIGHDFRMWDTLAGTTSRGFNAAVDFGTPRWAKFSVIGGIHTLNEAGGDA